MAQLAQTASTFIVRLWRDGIDGEWRGQITHLQSGVRRRFMTMAELAGLLEEQAPGFGSPDADLAHPSSMPGPQEGE